MKTTQAGLDLIISFETIVLHAYADPISHGEPFTIGAGSTNGSIPPGNVITLDTVIDRDTAIAWMSYNIEHNIEPAMDRVINYVLAPTQYDAMVDFCYNDGVGAFERSDILKYINAGDFPNAQLELLHYDKAGGEDNRGILRRRLAEAVMFGTLTRDELIAQALSGYDPDIA